MRTVAQAAGVAVSTVSKALRNDPSIPEARCRSIQDLARQMGYRPHPSVASLMAQLHHSRRRSDPHNIAWIDLWPHKKDSVAAMSAKPLLRGALERAEELGYGIEVYPAGEERISPEHLRSMLSARGQWGLIIPPVPESAMAYLLDMRGLTGVTIGTSLHEPVMHRVSPNHFQGGTLAFVQMRSKGFQRIGLVLSHAMNDRVEGKWLGAFLACQHRQPRSERLAPLIAADLDSNSLARWMRRERPDAVLVAETFDWAALERFEPGYEHRPALGWLMLPAVPHGLGGVDWRPGDLGRVAVELVVAQIHRNERCSPLNAHSVLIDAVWREFSSPSRTSDRGSDLLSSSR